MLIVDNIHKAYAEKIVARAIGFQAAKGEITALLGASGSGKSTLLHIIAGLVKPDAGDIFLNQRALNHVPPEQRQIAMMFQDFALFPHLNALENVSFGLKMRKISKSESQQRAHDWLEKMGLAEKAYSRVQTLSGGEQQRVALARALAISPELLLLDEPFSGIDTALREQLRLLVKEMVAKYDIPAVMVTHDAAEVAFMAQHILLLSKGNLIQSGTPAALLQRPASAQAARLLGCTNVSEKYYIPPQAIVFHHKNGTDCPVLHVFRQPNHHRVDVLHAQYGVLSAFVDDAVVARMGERVSVWVNPHDVVHFHAI